jgi:hypothetical protein
MIANRRQRGGRGRDVSRDPGRLPFHELTIESPSPEDISQYGRFPTDNEIVAAVLAAGV